MFGSPRGAPLQGAIFRKNRAIRKRSVSDVRLHCFLRFWAPRGVPPFRGGIFPQNRGIRKRTVSDVRLNCRMRVFCFARGAPRNETHTLFRTAHASLHTPLVQSRGSPKISRQHIGSSPLHAAWPVRRPCTLRPPYEMPAPPAARSATVLLQTDAYRPNRLPVSQLLLPAKKN